MNAQAPTTWYVKSNNDVFGPFRPQELMQQACNGILVGDSLISADSEGPWLKAESLQTLEMEWQVTPEGQDPMPRCHIMALRSWVEDEKVQPFWDILHIPTGEKYDVVDALCSALLSQNHLLEDHIANLTEQSGNVSDSSEPLSGLQETIIQLDQAKKEAAKWKSLYEDEIKRNESHEQELQQSNEELRAWQRKAAERIKAFQRRQVSYDEARQQADNLGDLAGDRDLTEAYQELHLQMTHLMDSLQLKSQLLDEARDHAKEYKLQLRRERKMAEEKVEQVSQLHEDTLDQLNRLEQGHLQLTRSFRELNDRLIKLRNKIPSEAPAQNETPAPTPKTEDPVSETKAPGKGTSNSGSAGTKIKMT